MSQAAQARYEQLFMDMLFQMQPGRPVDPDVLRTLAQTLKDLAASRQKFAQLRDAPKEPRRKRALTNEEKMRREREATEAGPMLVERMERILGLDDPGSHPLSGPAVTLSEKWNS